MTNKADNMDVYAWCDEDMDSDAQQRIRKVQEKRVPVSFSIPHSLAVMINEDDFQHLFRALSWNLSTSRDRDTISITRSIPFSELLALKQFITNLDDQEVQIESRGLLKQLSSVIELIVNGKRRKIGYLRNLPAALFAFLEDGYVDGWLYKMDDDGNALPYLVESVDYHPPRSKEDRPSVIISTIHYSFGKQVVEKFSIDSNDISGRTVSEVLYAKKGFLHETKAMKDQYLASLDLYNKYASMENVQFNISGVGIVEGSYRQNKTISVSQKGSSARAVNDESARKRVSFNLEASNRFWIGDYDADEESYNSIPVHPFIYMFHLGVHKHMWVAAKNLEVYKYNRGLSDKLILPESHKELINILTSDSEILMDDIIEGKGAGTIILCKGIPGVGKTLTAQVYSEVTERPLYNVNAGQLGTSVQEVEEMLTLVMERAERWGAVLLIDEADIYIRARGNDVHHNALVAVWLQIIEYYNGLMFLTTNRGDDVDDAIMSRCIATVAYKEPDFHDSVAIWKIMCDQAGLPLNDDDFDKLARTFPNAVGRDIEKLVRLTSRFVKKKGIKADVDSFIHCAAFRGMVSEQ